MNIPIEIILENILLYLNDEMLCKFARLNRQWFYWIQRHFRIAKIPRLLSEIEIAITNARDDEQDYADTAIDMHKRCLKLDHLSPLMKYRTLLFFYLCPLQCGLCFRNCCIDDPASLEDLVLIDSFSVRACPCILLHLVTLEQVQELALRIEYREEEDGDDYLSETSSIAEDQLLAASTSIPWRTVYKSPDSIAHYVPVTFYLRHLATDAMLAQSTSRLPLFQALDSIARQQDAYKSARRQYLENVLPKDLGESDMSFRTLGLAFTASTSPLTILEQSVLLRAISKQKEKQVAQEVVSKAVDMGVPKTVAAQVVDGGLWPEYATSFVQKNRHASNPDHDVMMTTSDDDLIFSEMSDEECNVPDEDLLDVSFFSLDVEMSFEEVTHKFALEISHFYEERRAYIASVQDLVRERCRGQYFGFSLHDFTGQVVDFIATSTAGFAADSIAVKVDRFLTHFSETQRLQTAWREKCMSKLEEYLALKTPALASRIVPLSTRLLQDPEFLIQDSVASEYLAHTPLPDILEEWLTSNPTCDTHFTTCLESVASRIVGSYRAAQCRNAMTTQLQSLWPQFIPLHEVKASTPQEAQFASSHVMDQYYQTTRVGSWIHTPVNCSRLFRHQVLARRMELECPAFQVSNSFPDAQTLYRSFISFDSILQPVCDGVWPTNERMDITVSLLVQMHNQAQDRSTQASALLSSCTSLDMACNRFLQSDLIQEWIQTPSLSLPYLGEMVAEMVAADVKLQRTALLSRLVRSRPSFEAMIGEEAEKFTASRTFQSCLEACGEAMAWIRGGEAALLDVGVEKVADNCVKCVDGRIDHVVVQCLNTLF